MNKNKLVIFMSTFVSMLAVFVGAISTLAWFQINQQDPQATLVSGSSNMSIQNDNVKGYKIEPPLGANGFKDYSVTNVESAAGSTITVDNSNQAGLDTDYDVPSEGVGYYLVQQTPGGLYRYKYDNNGDGTKETYATKFQLYQNTNNSATRAYIPSLTISANQWIRIRYYTFSNHTTVHKQIRVHDSYGNGVTTQIDSTSGDIKVVTAGTYRVWLDYTDENWDSNSSTTECTLGFESVSITSKDVNVRASTTSANRGSGTQRAATTSGTKTITQINLYDEVQWLIRTIKIDNVAVNAGYNFEDFVKAYYVTNLSTSWSNQGTTKGYKIAGTAYYLCAGGSNDGSTPYSFPLPEWVESCHIRICGTDSNGTDKEVWVGETNELHQYSDNNSSDRVGDNGNCWGKHINIYTKDWNYTYNACSTSDSANKDWGSVTVNLYAVNRQTNQQIGSAGQAGTTMTLSKYYIFNPSDISYSSSFTYSGNNYQYYTGWYKTYSSGSALSNQYSSTLLTDNTQTNNTLNLYAYYDQIFAVNLYASFFIIDKNGRYQRAAFTTRLLDTKTSVYNTAYNAPASGYDNSIYQADSTNGIYYKFARDNSDNNTNVWYTNEGCTTTYSSSTTTEARNLYAKFVADIRETSTTHKTFYVDIRNCYVESGGNRYGWDGVKVRDTTNHTDISTFQVAPNLFRVTLPTSISFQVYGSQVDIYGSSGHYNHDYAEVIGTNALSDISSNSILFIKPGTSGSNHETSWHYLVQNSSTGTAVVQYYSNGVWNDLVNMHVGDQYDTNAFVYEESIGVDAGKELRIQVTDGSYAGIYDNNDYATSLPFFLTSSGASSGGLITQGYVGTANFNFYVTVDRKFSIAMVPDLGNGFYIMNSKRASWNDVSTAFKMSQYTTGLNTSVYSDQFKGVVTFTSGDTFKIRSENWFDVNYETTNGAFASNNLTVSSDANKNVKVVTSGTYVIYLKIKNSGGYDVYIDTTEESTNAVTPDTSFTSGRYYIVGSSAFYTGTASTGSANVGFFGGLKMSSGSDISASYNGYYAQANSSIYIRSYINAVDTLCNGANANGVPQTGASSGCTILYGTVSTHTDVQINTTTGVITFGSNAAGYYNIYVYNNTVTVEAFRTSDFFRLNPIDNDTSKTNTTANINAQKTAVILEVPFICNNPYESKISLGMENCPNYVGAYLYCSATKLSDPYDTLHGKSSQSTHYTNLHSYQAGSRLNDVNNITIQANDPNVYYAYIVVDYLPGMTYPTSSTDVPQIYFYLTATQQQLWEN